MHFKNLNIWLSNYISKNRLSQYLFSQSLYYDSIIQIQKIELIFILYY